MSDQNSAPLEPGESLPSRLSFSLASLLLFMTLVSVGLGLFVAAPGLGVVFVVVALPALVRTALWSQWQRNRGRPLGMGEKTVEFMTSAAIVVAIAISAGIAFYATCWVGFIVSGYAMVGLFGGGGIGVAVLAFYIGIAIGVVVGIYCMYRVGRRMWPHRNVDALPCQFCGALLPADGVCRACEIQRVENREGKTDD